jgi:hypothetical protein
VQKAVASFWRRWERLYLTQLSAKTLLKQRMYQGKKGRDILKVGDVVMVKPPTTNVFLQEWSLARVISVLKNPHDQEIRIVWVKLPRNSKGRAEEMELTTGNISLLESVNE